MATGMQDERNPESHFCPECGMDESGYFCRNCGTLLRGEEMVLCPRCSKVVPHGDYCNQCGQGLEAIALDLQQLALAGGDFWVSAGTSARPSAGPDGTELTRLEPDESVVLVEAEVPDWLKELPSDSAPAKVQGHIYPSLRPIEEEVEEPGRQGRLMTPVFVLLALLLVGLVAVVVFLLLTGAL